MNQQTLLCILRLQSFRYGIQCHDESQETPRQ